MGEPVALVLELADVAQLLRLSGHSVEQVDERVRISRAFADAWVNRSKNSRFCGVRRRATAAFYQTRSPDRHTWLR